MSKTTVEDRDSSHGRLIGPGENVFLTSPAAPEILRCGAEKSRANLLNEQAGRECRRLTGRLTAVAGTSLGRTGRGARRAVRRQIRRRRNIRLAMALANLEQLIGNQKGSHQHQPVVTDLTEFINQPIHFGFHVLSERQQALLLTTAASQAIGPCVERNRDLPHFPPIGTPLQGAAACGLALPLKHVMN